MISINHIYMEHSGGTKYYECAHLHDRQTNSSLVIFHWGALRGGTEGSQSYEFKSLHEGDAKYRAQIRAKKGKGYAEESVHHSQTTAGASLKECFDQVEATIGKKFARFSKVERSLEDWLIAQHDLVVIEDHDPLDDLEALRPDINAGIDIEELQAAQDAAKADELRRLEADDGWGQF